MSDLPGRLRWLLEILREAHPATVQPQSEGMRKAAHWAWSRGFAMRHVKPGLPISYSISASGLSALRAKAKEAGG